MSFCFFAPDMLVLEFYKYLESFAKNWQIVDFANFVIDIKARKVIFSSNYIKGGSSYFFDPNMPVMDFFEYLEPFAKIWKIANFDDFFLRISSKNN